MSGFAPGAQVGRFRIEAEIGRGGMGVVYRALDLVLERPVALKGIAPNMGSDLEALSRFQREAAAAANLRHPHIAAVYEFGLHRDQPYIIFEWIEGRSLKALLRAERCLPLERARRLLDSLADALDYAHQQGVIHRDVKPGNILVTAGDRPIIVDFGLAWLARAPALSRPGAFFGTPVYMAPEQYLGNAVDSRTDLYSLAVVAYEMLAGRPPFVSETTPALFQKHVYVLPPRITTINPDLPPSVDSALMRALAKDPQARFPTGTAFSQALHGSAVTESKLTLLVEADDSQRLGVDIEAPTLLVNDSSQPLARGRSALSETLPTVAHSVAATQPPARRQPWLLLGLPLLLCLGLAGGAGWLGSRLLDRGLAGPVFSQTASPTADFAVAGANSPAAETPLPATPEPPASAGATAAPATLVMTVTVLVTSSAATATPSVDTPAPGPSAAPSATAASTAAASPTAAASLPAAASLTAAPGSGATLTPTASATPVTPTLSPSPSPAATATPPPSPTPVPSATPSRTLTPTAVPSATGTATQSPTPGCALSGGVLLFSTDTELVWNLQNNEAAPAGLASLEISWPDTPPAQTFQAALFGGTLIASSSDETPPSSLPSEVAWSGSLDDRQLAPGSAKDLQLQFGSKLKNKGYSITVTFDNGCVLNASN